MMLNHDEREAAREQITAAYDRLQAVLVAKRAEVKARVEEMVDAETQEERAEFARLLHRYHESGLPKNIIRQATRKAGNAPGFDKLWFAAPPPDVDLRRAVQVEATPEREYEILSENSIYIPAFDKTLTGIDRDDVAVWWDGDTDVEGEYTALVGIVQAFLKERDSA